jgi:spore germination protein YaaH
VPTPWPTHAAPPAPRLAAPEIFGYYVNWDLNAQIDYGAITTVAYFGLSAGSDGHLIRSDRTGLTTEYSRWKSTKVTNAIAQAHANGDRFVLTVERMAWDDGGKLATRALLSNPAARATLVTEIVNELATRGVNGVSLDFEPLLSDQRGNFAAFVNDLRVALDAANPMYQLTFAATGSQVALTYQSIGDLTNTGAADAVIIMGYPLRSIDAKYAGGLSPLISPLVYDLKQITNAYLKYVPPRNLVMALPWYGREWPTVTSDENSAVQTDRTSYDRAFNISYANAIALAAQYGRKIADAEQSAFTAFRWTAGPGCPETWKQVYYDDVETYSAKIDWLMSKGIAGVGIFALGYDDAQPELWKLMRVKFRGLVDATAPTGAVALAADEKLCRVQRVRLALAADDGADGSGAVFVRLSNSGAVELDGTLSQGRTYPATPIVDWPLDDPAVAGTASEGPRTVYAQWRDVAGNWSPPTSVDVDVSATASATVVVNGTSAWSRDAFVPVLVSQTGGRTISNVLVSADPSVSGETLAHAVAIAPGTASPFSLIDPQTGGSDADGVRTLYAQWQDSNGCWSAPAASTVGLDRTPPVGTVTLVDAPAVSTTGVVALSAPASDAASGMQTLQLSNDGTAWTSFTPPTDPVTWSAEASPDGAWTISARWIDVAGNVSAAQSVALSLDRAGPTGTLTLEGGAAFTRNQTVSVTAAATDAISGVSAVLVSDDPTLVDGSLANGTRFTPGTPIAWPLPDGVRTLYAQWQDGAGNWSSVQSATIAVDRTAPSLVAPVAQLDPRSQLGQSAVPVLLTWQASDIVSGLASTAAQVSRDGTNWIDAPQAGTTSASVQIDRTSTWQVRASGVDRAGNSASVLAPSPLHATVTEDSSAAVTYTGSWKKQALSSASAGSTRYATAKGATATIRFTGRSFAWVAPVGNRSGKAKVFVDGVLAATIDLRAAAQARQLVFSKSWTASGAHTIKIKVLATSGRPRVDVDAFVVLS